MVAFSLWAFVPECPQSTTGSKATAQEKVNEEEAGPGVRRREASREARYGRRVHPQKQANLGFSLSGAEKLLSS